MGKKLETQTIQVQMPPQQSRGVPFSLWFLGSIVVASALLYLINRMSDEQLNHAATVMAASVGGVLLLVIVFVTGVMVGRVSERRKHEANEAKLRSAGYSYELPSYQLPQSAWAPYNFVQPPPPSLPPEYSRPLGQTRSTANRGGGYVEAEPPGDWSDL